MRLSIEIVLEAGDEISVLVIVILVVFLLLVLVIVLALPVKCLNIAIFL